jgi:uncharacterized iron-regulated protein
MTSRRAALVALVSLPALLATRARAGDHPLIGTIWDAREQRRATRAALEAASVRADLLLLGETHDNPDHHRLQLDLIAALVAAGRRPAIAMEQFDREHQAEIDRARAERPLDAAYVAEAARFDAKGWEWRHYEPIVALALRHELPLVAANLSRRDAFAIVERGFEALGSDAAKLGLAEPLDAARVAAIEAAIRDGHCGKLPERIVPRMAAAQIARDAVMAEALLARSGAGAVLVAGNGHVRRDLGVPVHLERLAPRRAALAIGMLEVESGACEPAAYVAPAAGDAPQFDFAALTARTERPDPCARFAPRSGPPPKRRPSHDNGIGVT